MYITSGAELMNVKGIFACVDRHRQEMGEKEGYDMQHKSCTMPNSLQKLRSQKQEKINKMREILLNMSKMICQQNRKDSLHQEF